MRQEFVPIYLIMGMLESGKTTLIHTMLNDDGFSRGQKTLVLSCEEGEVEYDEALFAKKNAVLVQLEEPEELNVTKLRELNRVHRPERVFIEYNNMWTIERLGELTLPLRWRYTQLITLAEAATFDNYMTNVRKIFTDPMKESDLIMVNRCKPEDTKSAWRRQMRAFAPQANFLFENLDGTTEDGVADEDLPYDMKAEIIDIPDDMIGTFYIDALDHPDRYDGRTIRMNGQCFPDDETPKGYYYFGRYAMTCCANDIAKIGWITQGAQTPSETKFVKLTALCEKVTATDGQPTLMLHEKLAEKGFKPLEKYVTFS